METPALKNLDYLRLAALGDYKQHPLLGLRQQILVGHHARLAYRNQV